MRWLRTATERRKRNVGDARSSERAIRSDRVKRQRGVGALEYIAVATAALFSVIQGMHWWQIYGNNQDDIVNSGQLVQVMKGATQYLNSNTPGASGVIPWATIAPYMPAGMTGAVTNTWGQGYQLAVQVVGSTVNAMVETTGGTAIPENRMRSIAELAGTSGGYITSLAPTLATGTNGNWSTVLANFGASPGTGHMVGSLFYQSASAMNGSYLWRVAVPGQPQLNTMTTNIAMGGNSITGVGQVQTAAGNGVQIGSSYYYGDTTNSAIRQNGALFVQNQAGTAYAQINSGTVNATGDVDATGNVNAPNGTVTGAFLYSTGSLQANGSATIGGNAQVNGSLNANGYVTVQGGATPGGGCGGAAVGNSTTGSGTLLCESGVWTAASTPPSGTICGMASNGGEGAGSGNWCQGMNPYYGCPVGYTQYGFRVNFGDSYMYWCAAN